MSPRTVVGLGWLLILAGVILNESFVASIVSPDGVISSGDLKLLIRLSEIVIIAVGLLLVSPWRGVKAGRIAAKTALCVASAVLLIAAFDLLLRLVDKGTGRVYHIEDLEAWMENPNGSGSYRAKPNLDLVYSFSPYQTSFAIRTNSFGMKWREIAVAKPNGKERIAFVGDGLTEGAGAVRMEESAVGVFDSLIDQQRYEVLNFGVFAYGLDDVELLLKEEILRFAPDYLFVMVDNANDFRDTYLGLDKYDVSSGKVLWRADLLRSKIPEESLPEVPYSTYAVMKPRKRLRDQFPLLRHLENLYSATVSPRDSLEIRREIADFEVTDGLLSWSSWSRTEYPDVANRAKNATLECLKRIYDLSRRNRVGLFIVAVPFEEQIYAREPKGTDHNGVSFDVSFPQGHVEAFAAEHAIPYLDLLPALRVYVREGGELYPRTHNDQHFSREGDAKVGRLIHEFFGQRME